ncbi:MAG: quinone-dependent dihydroorotate dehydrogenase [Pseudomonadota bacterium]
MRVLERLGLSALRCLDPEQAHWFALRALDAGLAGGAGPVTAPRLETEIAGIALPNPVGIAAGFDKNAVAVGAALRTGVGFTEIGAVTPRPQAGNPRPRLFRLTEDRAAINRFGFNNDGMERILANLTARPFDGVVGVNLGANKETEDKAEDYIAVLRRFHGHVRFATINVSSPNTERLRDLQGRAALSALLGRVVGIRDGLSGSKPRLPVFLKIAPDLDDAEIVDIAEVAMAQGIDAIVATNTTLARAGLRSAAGTEAGGLSGAPLFQRSTAVLSRLYALTGGSVPLIGVGGIATAEEAYAKIRAGASAVQLYTAMIYDGVSLGGRIAEGLDALLARDGYACVADAVGADHRDGEPGEPDET